MVFNHPILGLDFKWSTSQDHFVYEKSQNVFKVIDLAVRISLLNTVI
jgi:hypothetical protein